MVVECQPEAICEMHACGAQEPERPELKQQVCHRGDQGARDAAPYAGQIDHRGSHLQPCARQPKAVAYHRLSENHAPGCIGEPTQHEQQEAQDRECARLLAALLDERHYPQGEPRQRDHRPRDQRYPRQQQLIDHNVHILV
ncbi:MAG TPA: hypothetical protein DGT21_00475 [Armatimonadetes bacterium]|nr:hypothetical protein [Armatimonadota bacterium]